jgi:16S rRNA (guanine527-N7)-methyltransferase
VTVLRARAEEVRGEPGFDAVLARAVAPLERLAGWGLPLLRPGGVLLALKGASAAEELAAAEPALAALGAASWAVRRYAAGGVDPPTIVVEVVAGSLPRPGKAARKRVSRETARGSARR